MDMDSELDQLGTVIVSGGASGLGDAVVRHLQVAGGHPVVLDIRPPAGQVDCELVDVADSKGVEEAVHRVARAHGDLRAVVTCAGIDVPGPITQVTSDDWERVVGVNLLGTASVVRAVVPYLERTGGRIVTIASTLGHRVLGDATAYCASKFGVVGFTRALAAELKGRVGVTLVSPGGMDTAFFAGRDDAYRPPAEVQLSDPSDAAVAVLFALMQPPGIEVKELVVAGPTETSWP